MVIELKQKKILLTGATGGIGKALVGGLVQSGAQVVAHFNDNQQEADRLVSKFGNQVIPVQGDLSRPDQVKDLFDAAVEAMQGLNVLINNAGVAIFCQPQADDTKWLKDWERTINVNLTAAALLCKKALEVFTRQHQGTIINISSRAAFRGDRKEYLAYAASKGGMVSLTRSIARAYGKEGIVAFDLAPGFVETNMAQDFFDQYGKEVVLDEIALGQLTSPPDLVPLVVLLASGLADHATGTSIDVNAGSYVH